MGSIRLREVFNVVMRPALWGRKTLHAHHLDDDPFTQFDRWYKRACRNLLLEFPNAMCLSTIDADGYPEGRLVLLKGYDAQSFVFYSNTESDKGRALAGCPRAALNFYWPPLQRQVRIQGDVEPVTAEEADEYFKSRPRGSQIGAWASQQSRVLESRDILNDRVQDLVTRYRGQDIPRPDYWSGYRVIPRRFEFWELRLNRLHDRFVYERCNEGGWKVFRIYP